MIDVTMKWDIKDALEKLFPKSITSLKPSGRWFSTTLPPSHVHMIDFTPL